MKKFFLIPLMALCSCVMAFAAEKASLTIQSGDALLKAVVADDYTVTVNLPNAAAKFKAAGATIDVAVAGNTPRHKEITTSLTESYYEYSVTELLANAYQFANDNKAVTLSVNVDANDAGTASFSYDVNGLGGNVIKATTVKADVDAVKELVRSQCSETANTSGDTYLYLAPGSYITYGNETITINSGLRLFGGDWALGNMPAQIEAASDMTSYTVNSSNRNQTFVIEVELAAGSKIASNGRVLTLLHKMTATADLLAAKSSTFTSIRGRFSDRKNQMENLSATTSKDKSEFTMLAAFKFIDVLVGDLMKAGNIPAEVIFEPDPIISFNYREGLNIGQFYTLTIDRPLISLEGASLWEIAKFESAYPRLELVEALAPVAGMPYIVIADSTAIRATAYRDATIEQFGQNNNGLYGVLEGDATDLVSGIACKQLTTGDYMVQNNQYGPVGTTAYVRPGRAYIKLAEVSPVDPDPAALVGRRRMTLGGGNKVPTGIVTTEEATTAAKTIVDGQLIIIRDGVKYNAQGAVVE